MNFKYSKSVAFVLAFCVIIFSTTGCIINKTENNSVNDINFETTSQNEELTMNETDSLSEGDNSDTENDEEITQVQAETEYISTEDDVPETEAIDSDTKQTGKRYKPKEEIINADFSSGLMQIGNDVFRLGGYYTVEQFISEFGDRYDMSNIDTESVWVSRENSSAEVSSLNDPDLVFTITCRPAGEDECLFKDAIVHNFIVNGNFVYHPMGLAGSPDSEDLKIDDVEQFLESLGLIRMEKIDYEHYDCYACKINNNFTINGNGIVSYKCNFKGNEMSLLGDYPIYRYSFLPLEQNSEIIKDYDFSGMFSVSVDIITELGQNGWTSAK